MEHGSRTRLVTALVLAAVFGAGVLMGFAADFNPTATAAEPNPGDAEAVEPSEPEAPRRRRFYEQVGANEEQLERIQDIVAEHRARTNALDEELRAEYRAGFRGILFDTREAIKGVLTPEQAEEYQRLLDEWDARQAEEAGEREDGEEGGSR